MRLHDGLIALLLTAFAVALIVHAAGFPPMLGQAFGPAMLPTVIGVALIGASALLAAGAFRSRARQPLVQIDDWVRSPKLLFDFFLTIAGVVFYIAFSEQLGYLLAAPIALLAFLFAAGVRWVVAVPVAAIVPLIIHYIFYTVLKVPLPWGLLVEYAW
jgi:putative tricarboxylic transport membrane protein